MAATDRAQGNRLALLSSPDLVPAALQNSQDQLLNLLPAQALLRKVPSSLKRVGSLPGGHLNSNDLQNHEIAMKLEAIKSYSNSLRSGEAIGPQIVYNDDAIQRVVSQMRSKEQDNGGNYKFEIERTDSLEFSRNSVTEQIGGAMSHNSSFE